MSEKNEREPKSKLGVGDILKTVVSTGVTAASLGEEVVKGVVENVKAVKGELLTQAKDELQGWLEKVNLSQEIDRVLSEYDLDVQAKVSFKKKTDATKTSASSETKGK
jgi:hypothetical protein